MSDAEFMERIRRVAAGGRWSTPEEDIAAQAKIDSGAAVRVSSMGRAGAAVEAKAARENYARLLRIMDSRSEIVGADLQGVGAHELADV